MTGLILAEQQEGICTLTLNNPRKKNALSLALLAELEQGLERLQSDSDLRAVILQGAEGTFSVGADLSDVTGTVADQEIDERIQRVNQLMRALPVPCLAAIEGPCVGGAVTVALACDALVASERAFFQIPATRLGLLYSPDAVAQFHARLGSRALMRLLLRGNTGMHKRPCTLASWAGWFRKVPPVKRCWNSSGTWRRLPKPWARPNRCCSLWNRASRIFRIGKKSMSIS